MAKSRQPLDPTALTVEDVAQLLSTMGRKTVLRETILADIAAGAPTNPDGTINLVNYAAWMVMEMGHCGD